MNPAGEGDEMGGSGETRTPCGVGGVGVGAGAYQNLGAETGSRKRKAAAMSVDSNDLISCREGSELGCEDSQKILLQIENLRSQLDEYEKQLGYRKENEKLRVEMDLKDKEVQCLRKQNEELQLKYEGLQIKYKKQNEELQAMCDDRNMEQELQTIYKKQNEELETNFEKQNKELQSKYKKQKEELQSKYEKQKKELQAKFEEQKKDMQSYYKTQKEELQVRFEEHNKDMQSDYKRSEELQTKCTGLLKKIDAKRRQLRQLEELYITMKFPLTQLKDGKRIPDILCDKDSNFVDEWAEKSGVVGKADDENLKCLELEVAKLDAEIQTKMKNLGEILEHEKFLGVLSSAAAWKSTQMNMELQDIRRELIMGLNDLHGYDLIPKHRIGVKMMGKINFLSFRDAFHQKYGKYREVEIRACIVASLCQDELKNPSWHPFKIVGADGRFQRRNPMGTRRAPETRRAWAWA